MRGVLSPERAWSRGERAKAAAKVMVGWVALLWLLELIDVASGHALDDFGVMPRAVPELVDVVPSAFIHFGFGHVAANSVPLLVLGFLSALGGLRRFAAVCALIIVADGLGVWLISPDNSNTAGASGVVFGLFGFLLVSGFVERRLLGVAVGVVIAGVWGGSILAGIAPTQTGISWQGHLIGLVTGVAAAFLFRRRADGAALRATRGPQGGGSYRP